jgi:hypothetical protein
LYRNNTVPCINGVCKNDKAFFGSLDVPFWGACLAFELAADGGWEKGTNHIQMPRRLGNSFQHDLSHCDLTNNTLGFPVE